MIVNKWGTLVPGAFLFVFADGDHTVNSAVFWPSEHKDRSVQQIKADHNFKHMQLQLRATVKEIYIKICGDVRIQKHMPDYETYKMQVEKLMLESRFRGKHFSMASRFLSQQYLQLKHNTWEHYDKYAFEKRGLVFITGICKECNKYSAVNTDNNLCGWCMGANNKLFNIEHYPNESK